MESTSGETFSVRCPQCGKHYRAAVRIAGKTVKCNQCGTQWQVQADKPAGLGEDSQAIVSLAEGSLMGSSQVVDAGEPGSANSNSRAVQDTSDKAPPVPKGKFDDKQWIGKQLGRFTITGMLGKGAMGVVYRARDPDLNRDVALKILTKQFFQDEKRTYRLEQFIREARSAAKLQHPNSVTVYEAGKDGGWYFIAMELVEGGTLLDLMRRKEKLPVEQACELVAQAADTLSAAHRAGIVHRDIKPSNLMLTKSGKVKVADFGLAQLSEPEDDFELPSKAVGTPYWMSPEQCRGKPSSGKSDIYSLGAVLYYVITGDVPYTGTTRQEILKKHISAPPPDLRKDRKDVPEALVRIFNRCLAKNPDQRYQDAGELAIGLRQVAAGISQAKTAERRWGQLASSGISKAEGPVRQAGLWNPLSIVLAIVGIGLLGVVVWQIQYPRIKIKIEPGPAPPAEIITLLPIVAEKEARVYHLLNCISLQQANVDPADLLLFGSEAQARQNNLSPCQYCKSDLERYTEYLNKPAEKAVPAPPKPEEPG